MPTFRLHWLDGKVEDIEGDSVRDAFNHAGIGNGALRALDYWEPIDEEESIEPRS